MAEKEYLLGNRARELLRYTNQATRIVSDEVSAKDVRAIIRRIARLGDIRDVKTVCFDSIHVLDVKKKDGFTRSMFKLYGEDMRFIAKGIVKDIHSANDKHFATEHQERLRKISDVLDGCSLLLEYIQICLEEETSSAPKGRSLDEESHGREVYGRSLEEKRRRAGQKAVAEAATESDKHQFELVKSACRAAFHSDRQ